MPLEKPYILHLSLTGKHHSLPFSTQPAKFSSVRWWRLRWREAINRSRLKPLDLQKHRGEVMIGALIGASHWGLKAHRGHVSFGSKALPTLPQIHHPRTPKHIRVVEGEGESFTSDLKATTKNSSPSSTVVEEVPNDEEKDALSPVKKTDTCESVCVFVGDFFYFTNSKKTWCCRVNMFNRQHT